MKEERRIRMILVDIQVPVLDQIYDFELEEDFPAEAVLAEILALIVRRMGVSIVQREEIRLYSMARGKVLEREKTLRDQKIRAGDRLILI